MKRHGDLYRKIISEENLKLAYQKSRKGKAWQRNVKEIDQRQEYYLSELLHILQNKEYKTSQYKTKMIYEPKFRTIYILPYYPDRIMQHAIMNVLEPIWDKLFIYDSYACRQGKGQHKGSLRCMQFVKRNKYCLKCDISKFYPSVNHEKLLKIIKRKIKCKDTLVLLEEIINSIEGESNVPIGNYLSQWFGNLYMNELDQSIKHKYHIKDYIRYCDDFLLFSNSKEKLNQMKLIIEKFITEQLKMKLSKCDLFPVTQGVDFLGYRHFPQGYILLRKTTAKRVKKRLKSLFWKVKHKKISKESAISTIASTKGWLRWANTHNMSLSLKIMELETEIKEYE